MNSEHYNALTPVEAELLALVSEECGEVVGAVGKILRHGLRGRDPRDIARRSNREHLERELGQVLSAMALLTRHGVLRLDEIMRARREKLLEISQWLHHATVDGLSERERSAYTCAQCEAPVRTEWRDSVIPYGVGEEAVDISCRVPVRVCDACGFESTDDEGETQRERAVERYLAEKHPSHADVADLKQPAS